MQRAVTYAEISDLSAMGAEHGARGGQRNGTQDARLGGTCGAGQGQGQGQGDGGRASLTRDAAPDGTGD
jgi:hypothetical protein